MKLEKYERLFSLMTRYGVSRLKHGDLEIAFGVQAEVVKPSLPVELSPAPSPQAIPPVEMQIPHHENEVANLLKLSDNDLVEKLFPDYSQSEPKE